MFRRTVAALAAIALLGACSDDSDPHVSTKKRAPVPSTTAVTSSFVEPRFVDAPQDYTTTGDFQNGHQIGGLQAADIDARTIEVDFIQFLSGAAAIKAYREDTGEADEPPNDYWIRNSNKQLRTLTVAPDALITVNTLGGHEPTQHEAIDLARLEELMRGTRGDADYRLPLGFTIKDGVVTAIEQLYVP